MSIRGRRGGIEEASATNVLDPVGELKTPSKVLRMTAVSGPSSRDETSLLSIGSFCRDAVMEKAPFPTWKSQVRS